MFENQYLTAARWVQLTICAKKTSVILTDAPKWNNRFWHGRFLLASNHLGSGFNIIFYKFWTFWRRKPFKSIIQDWNCHKKSSELMAGLIEIVFFYWPRFHFSMKLPSNLSQISDKRKWQVPITSHGKNDLSCGYMSQLTQKWMTVTQLDEGQCVLDNRLYFKSRWREQWERRKSYRKVF